MDVNSLISLPPGRNTGWDLLLWRTEPSQSFDG